MWWVDEIMLAYDSEEKEAYHGLLVYVNQHTHMCVCVCVCNGLNITFKPNNVIYNGALK